MQKALRIIRTDDIIFNLFACWCLVDTLSGMMSGFLFFSLSQIVKALVAALVIFRCSHNQAIVSCVSVMIIYLSISVFHSAIIGEDVPATIILMSKLLTSILFFVYFIQVKKSNGRYFEDKAFLVLKWNFLIFSLNIALGLVGIGNSTYNVEDATVTTIGSHGFIHSTNEMAGVLAVVFSWAFYYFKQHYSFIVYLFLSALLFFLAYAMSTKAGILATALSFISITYFYGKKNERRVLLLFFIVAVYYAAKLVQLLLESEVPIVQRFSYFFERDGLLNALTSGRLGMWEEERGDYTNSGLLTLLIGLGGGRTVEMDFYDILLNCGIVGVVVFGWTYIKMLISPLKKRIRELHYIKVIFTSNFLLVVISLIAGHIVFSSMAGMLIALSNALLFGKYGEGKTDVQIQIV